MLSNSGGEFLFSNLLSCKMLRYHYLYMMKKIPEKIEEIFCRRMQKAGVAYPLQQEYRKWLRYYLDFCSKYYLNPTDREIPQPGQRFFVAVVVSGQGPDASPGRRRLPALPPARNACTESHQISRSQMPVDQTRDGPHVQTQLRQPSSSGKL